MVIILLGPPGAGKGTQGELLAEKFDLFHWETSRIVGRIINRAKKGEFVIAEGKKYYFEKEKKLREKGLLWDPPFLVECIRKKIEELASEGEGIVLSGSPRTLYEGKKLIPLLKKLYGKKNIRVVVLNLSDRQSIWRNSHRRECSLMRHSILFTKETANLTRCPLDGSKLVVRKDDTVETIKKRLRVYRERTFPVINYFKEKRLKLIEVNGGKSVEALFKDILKKL